MLLEWAEENDQKSLFVNLDHPEYWLPEISNVFHGRDIFAPVAAYLASGVPLSSVGTLISDPVRLDIPKPVHTMQGWQGQVIHIDHFGNLSTNIRTSHLKGSKEVVIHIREENITGLVSTFGERPSGTLVALLDSSGSLAISVVNGSAAQFLHASVGDKLEVFFRG
jgi:S-adenosylmethionine hydrolase